MTLVIDWIAVDCRDPRQLGAFWAQVLGYDIDDGESNDDEVMVVPREGQKPRLLFLRVAEGKTVKNRLHFDLRPDDQAAEVQRVNELGATEVDIGQRDVTWTVMADPEGNEFCILRTLTDPT